MRGTLLFVTCLVALAYSNPVNEKKGCTISSHCPNDFHCHKSECVDPCTDGICGSGASCRAHKGNPVCSCPKGFDGNPFMECRPKEDSKVTVKQMPSNPVDEKKGCTIQSDCPNYLVCHMNECVDPCTDGICGSGALCEIIDHNTICSCPEGFDGNPFIECRPKEDSKVTVEKLPSVIPCNGCGLNTTCTIRNEKVVLCTCLEGMTGDPFDFCVPIDG